MEQQQIQSQGKSSSKTGMWVALSILLTALIVGGGVFTWQQSSLSSTEEDLQAQIDALETQLMMLEEDMDSSEDGAVVVENDGEVSVTPSGTSSQFEVFIGSKKVATITEEVDSNVTRIVDRGENVFIGLNPDGIGGVYYSGSSSVWVLNTLDETIKKLPLSNSTVRAVSIDGEMTAGANPVTGIIGVGDVDGRGSDAYVIDEENEIIIGDMLFSPDGDKLAVETYIEDGEDIGDATVYIVDLFSGDVEVVETKEDSYLTPVEWSGNNKVLTSTKHLEDNTDL